MEVRFGLQCGQSSLVDVCRFQMIKGGRIVLAEVQMALPWGWPDGEEPLVCTVLGIRGMIPEPLFRVGFPVTQT